MHFDNVYVQTVVKDLIERYVPAGVDDELHLDRRAVIKNLILSLVETRNGNITIAEIRYVCKNWKEILYQRAVYAN